MKFFNDERFHRIIWLDPISRDPNICNPKRVAELVDGMRATALHYVATAPLSGRMFYESKYRPKEPFLKPDEDYLASIIAECHQRNIKVVAYFNCHWVSKDNLPEDKEWIATRPDGSYFGEAYGKVGTAPCLNSPDYIQTSKDILTEITENYDVDGIFFDGPLIPLGTCYCNTCKTIFCEKYGADLPVDPAWGEKTWSNAVRFKYETMANYFNVTSQTVKAIRDIPVYKNGTPLTISWWHGVNAEFDPAHHSMLGGEHFVFYGNPLDTPVFGAGATAKYYQAVSRGRVPTTVYLSYSHKCWHHYSLPSADIHQLIAEVAAHGGFPFVTVDDYNTINDSQNFAGIRDAFSFIEKNESYFKIRSRQKVALVWSQTSVDFYTHARIKGGGGNHFFEIESTKEYAKEVKGFYDMLVQAHIPFDIITDTGIDEGDLRHYDCLILANTACLTTERAQIIRSFVEAGGTLISTNETGLYDPDGNPHDDFLLKDVMGVTTGGIQSLSDLDKLIYKTDFDFQAPMDKGHFVFSHTEKTYVPVPDLCLRTKSLPGAEVLAKFYEPHAYRYAPYMGTGIVDEPSIVLNRHGKGVSYYFGGNIGEMFLTHNTRDMRNMVASIIRKHVELPVSMENDPAIEIHLGESDSTVVLHLINWAARIKRPVEKIYPIYDVAVRFPGIKEPRSVRSLAMEKDLEFKRSGSGIETVLPVLNRYDLLVVQKS